MGHLKEGRNPGEESRDFHQIKSLELRLYGTSIINNHVNVIFMKGASAETLVLHEFYSKRDEPCNILLQGTFLISIN